MSTARVTGNPIKTYFHAVVIWHALSLEFLNAFLADTMLFTLVIFDQTPADPTIARAISSGNWSSKGMLGKTESVGTTSSFLFNGILHHCPCSVAMWFKKLAESSDRGISVNETTKAWQCFDIASTATVPDSPLNASMGTPTALSTIDEMSGRLM